MKRLACFLMLVGLYGCNPRVANHYPNGSTDGRFHTCGYVTEDGVTEHLDDYKRRCGDG